MEVILDFNHRMPVHHPALPRILEACLAATQRFSTGERPFLKVLIGGNEDWLHVYATAKSEDSISSFITMQDIMDVAKQTKLRMLIRTEPTTETYSEHGSTTKVHEAFCRFSVGRDEGPIQYSDALCEGTKFLHVIEPPQDKVTKDSS